MPMYSSGGITLPAPSRAARNGPTASKGHFTGHLVAGDGSGRAIQVESHLEMKTALVLLARPDVVDLEEQVPFEWADEHGELRTHFFDFRASLQGGARIAIVVKPRRRLESGRFFDTIQAIASQVMHGLSGSRPRLHRGEHRSRRVPQRRTAPWAASSGPGGGRGGAGRRGRAPGTAVLEDLAAQVGLARAAFAP